MNQTKQIIKNIGMMVGSFLLVLCLTLSVGKIQTHAAAYLNDVNSLGQYICENGGSCIVTEQKVQLTSDFESDEYLFLSLNNGDVILDLNNHSMKFSCSKGIVVYGSDYTLQIMNSGLDKTKAVISTTGKYSYDEEVSTIKVSGKVKLSDLTIKNNAICGEGNAYAIQQPVKSSELSVKNCKIESTGSCIYQKYGSSVLLNCTVTTNGMFPAVLLENQGTMSIDKGVYQNTGASAAVSVQGYAIEGDAMLDIKMGTFKGVNKALDISGDRAVVTYSYNPSIYTISKTANTLKIVPKVELAKPKISKVSAGKKAITVTMSKKVSDYYAEKYQIGYRQKGTKSWKYINTSLSKKTIKSLKAGKKYQVRVRAYKTIDKTKRYSNWSLIKTSASVKK